jgi:hypothetical protein
MNAEYPQGYKEAYEKHLKEDEDIKSFWMFVKMQEDFRKELDQFDSDSGAGVLKKYVSMLNPMPRDKSLPEYQEFIKNIRGAVAQFDSYIPEAVHAGNTDFVEKLLNAMRSPELPKIEWNGTKAALRAFRILFDCKEIKSREHWPTKKQVRGQAQELLGYEISDRHWPRIFKEAGLWQLSANRFSPDQN